MIIDKVTFKDLSIFVAEEDQKSVFDFVNLTETNGGRICLKQLFEEPLQGEARIESRQEVLKFLGNTLNEWPALISNGCILMIEKFFSTAVENMPSHPSSFSAANYKVMHLNDYSLVKYSMTHFVDFFQGMHMLVERFLENAPDELAIKLNRVKSLVKNHLILQRLIATPDKKKMSTTDILEFGNFFKGRFKEETFELLDMYSLFDAWRSMAKAQLQFALTYPTIVHSSQVFIDGKQIRHVLLNKPVAYDVELKQGQNFIFLTGANMAGKSTFIKAIGIAVFMAHLGMAVPAQTFRLSVMDGLLSNIQVEDNISRGESYFFNEVQRIKHTVQKINNNKKWIVLIDELFKGTNVEDAMKCSSTVIKGLIKIPNSLFILSTHLYEIGEDLKQYPNINFKYFETFADGQQLSFSYLLKDGISNDRLGYLILKREGVVDMLESI